MKLVAASLTVILSNVLPPALQAECGNPSLEKGKVALEKNDVEAAITHLTEAIRKDPKLANAYFLRGQAYHNKGELKKAYADFGAAIKIDEKLAAAFLGEGEWDPFLERGERPLRILQNASI